MIRVGSAALLEPGFFPNGCCPTPSRAFVLGPLDFLRLSSSGESWNMERKASVNLLD